jgi:VWFA-related protein
MIRSALRAGTAAVLPVLVGVMVVVASPLAPAPDHQQTPPTPQNQRPPVFRGGAVLVTVDAYPRRDGHLIEGLTAADFEVREDGKPQKIEAFEFIRIEPNSSDSARRDPNTVAEMNDLAADPHNRVFVLFLDKYHLIIDASHNGRRPLAAFLDRLLGPADLVGVTTPDLPTNALTLGRKLTSIDDLLARFWTWNTNFAVETPREKWLQNCYGARTPSPETNAAIVRALVARDRVDRTFQSLEGLMAALAMIREERKNLLLISSGWALDGPATWLLPYLWGTPPGFGVTPQGTLTVGNGRPGGIDKAPCDSDLARLANIDFPQRLRDLVGIAGRSNVSFYPIDPLGLGSLDPFADPAGTGGYVPNRNALDGLRVLAANTDGDAVVGTNDLEGGLRRITDDVSAYYLLGYYSTNTALDGKYRQIEVRLTQPSMKVSARKGYRAPTSRDGPPTVTGTVPAATSPSAVDEALGILARLRASSDLYAYGVVDAGEVVVAVEIPSTQIEAGHYAQGADAQAVVTTATGEAVGTGHTRIDPATRSAWVHVPVTATTPGPFRVSIQVGTGAETLTDRFDVSAGTGRLLGAALVSRGTPAARSALRAVADFQFRRTERVHVEWPILRTLDQREARVLGRTGQPLAVAATLTERDVSGRTWLAADVNLSPLAEGDYLIEVVAGSGTDTERKLVAVRVVR